MEKISATSATTLGEHNLVEIKSTNSNNTSTMKISTESELGFYEQTKPVGGSVRASVPSRANFKKSNTCGSLFAKCGCDGSSFAPISAAGEIICDRQRPKLQRQTSKLKNLSFSHPDTTIVFTEENRYPVESPNRLKPPISSTINTKNGTVEVKHRSSSPNLGNYTEVHVHPDIQVKVTPRIESDVDTRKPRPLLKKSSQSFPALPTTTTSFDNSGNAQSFSKSLSLEEESESDLEKFRQITDLKKSGSNNSKTASIRNVFNPIHSNKSNGSSDESLDLSPSSPKNINNSSARQFFQESGILGPMGGMSSLLRKASKVAPIHKEHMGVDHIRKTSVNVKMPHAEDRHRSVSENTAEYYQDIDNQIYQAEHKVKPESKMLHLQDEIFHLKKSIRSRDDEITKLKQEIHKLKSVLQQSPNNNKKCECDLLSSPPTPTNPATPISLPAKLLLRGRSDEDHLFPLQSLQSLQQCIFKKQGVSGESCESSGQSSDILVKKYDKDFKSKQLIKDAIMENDFLKNLDSIQIRELIDSMYSRDIDIGEFVVRQGEAGTHLFVSADGMFEVIGNDIVFGVMGAGKAFGELAVLYNCTRTASIRAIQKSRVWVLDRRMYQQIMMRTGMQRLEENVNFLRSVPLLKNLSNDVLLKIADVLEVEFYEADKYILRQGCKGDSFYLISQGKVKVTQRVPGSVMEKEIRELERGAYFGEQALIKEDKRTANIIACSPGVECLTLDRESFSLHIGDLCELLEKDYGDEERQYALSSMTSINEPVTIHGGDFEQDYLDIALKDLNIVATIGVGGFGRVELVKYVKNNIVQVFALKCMRKQHVLETNQQEHVFNERKIMMSCRSPFICTLYRTFRDEKFIYLLMEACMGGEVWQILRDRTGSRFNEFEGQFIVGCVLEAFEYLHARGIVYRDLKPENLMITSNGYIKLVDFGFSKFIGYSNKTWTFCGTPEYVAPEVILNKGHDRSVDIWALGILMYELLVGTPPFTTNDPLKTYNLILKGIDILEFPRYISRSAISLIKKLCRDNPTERLGYHRNGIENIKKHRWFQGFDWEGLASQKMVPPPITTVNGPLDLQNFDTFPIDEDFDLKGDASTSSTDWDADF